MGKPINFRYNRIAMVLIMLVLLICLLYIYVDYSHIISDDIPQSQELLLRQPSLTFKNRIFYLKGRPLQILSGSMHYFRIHRKYWRDRLAQLKAAGFNTVDTCIPWNLHEKSPGIFNFHGNLNVRKFCQIAESLGLHVILKPGPFVGAQIDFGGLPGWLLKDPNMRVRSLYMGFTRAVDAYFQVLMHQLADLQAANGGPVIAIQLEHEYGSYGDNRQYLHFLRHALRKYGAVEAFYSCESADGIGRHRRLDGSFVGLNFNDVYEGRRMIGQLQAWDRHLPVFVSELWTGHYLTWDSLDRNDVIRADTLATLARQLAGPPLRASFSAHPFHGGSNFGFVGAAGVTASHDWDAPVSEAGLPTVKYRLLASALAAGNASGELAAAGAAAAAGALAPSVVAYGNISINSFMKWNTLIELVENVRLYETAKFMEDIDQNFGYILYRSRFASGQVVTVDGFAIDRGLILVNGEPVDPTDASAGQLSAQTQRSGQSHVSLRRASLSSDSGGNSVDLLVENTGRASVSDSFQSPAMSSQRRGLSGPRAINAEQLQTPGRLLVNERPVSSYKIYGLPFDAAYLAKASVRRHAWSDHIPVPNGVRCVAPALYRAVLTLAQQGSPADTYLDMSGWTRGQVFVNGFNLGRYWGQSPQRTMYLPGPLLRRGDNEIIIFELHRPADWVTFVDSPRLVFPV